MKPNFTATAQTTIKAPLNKVWDAFVNPESIKKYMFGTTVISDWKVGSPIVWKGEWKGKPYEDSGTIVELKPNERLAYTHFSPLTGQPDLPENYHTISIDFTESNGHTLVSLSQDNNATEQEKTHSEQNWGAMLEQVKQLLENEADN